MRVSADYYRIHDPEERNSRPQSKPKPNPPSVNQRQVDYARIHDPEERNKKSTQDKVEISPKAKEISKNQPPIQVAKNSSPGYTYTDKAKKIVGEVIEFVKGAGDATLTNVSLGAIENKYNSNHPTAYKMGQLAGNVLSLIDGPGEAKAITSVVRGAKTGVSNTVKSAEELYNLGNKKSGVAASSAKGTGSAETRPTWRQSERDASNDYPGYQTQQSFKDGKAVSHGTKGSSRPDLYTDGHSIEVKNYSVTTSQGRNNLINNVSAQVNKRKTDLPHGTLQTVQIDVRGQNASRQELKQIRDGINKKTNNGAEVIFKMN